MLLCTASVQIRDKACIICHLPSQSGFWRSLSCLFVLFFLSNKQQLFLSMKCIVIKPIRLYFKHKRCRDAVSWLLPLLHRDVFLYKARGWQERSRSHAAFLSKKVKGRTRVPLFVQENKHVMHACVRVCVSVSACKNTAGHFVGMPGSARTSLTVPWTSSMMPKLCKWSRTERSISCTESPVPTTKISEASKQAVLKRGVGMCE